LAAARSNRTCRCGKANRAVDRQARAVEVNGYPRWHRKLRSATPSFFGLTAASLALILNAICWSQHPRLTGPHPGHRCFFLKVLVGIVAGVRGLGSLNQTHGTSQGTPSRCPYTCCRGPATGAIKRFYPSFPRLIRMPALSAVKVAFMDKHSRTLSSSHARNACRTKGNQRPFDGTDILGAGLFRPSGGGVYNSAEALPG